MPPTPAGGPEFVRAEPLKAAAVPTDAGLCQLVHDLRQPLSVIETCTFFLRLVLDGCDDRRVIEHLEQIERELDAAGRILAHAAAGVLSEGRPPGPPAASA